MIAPPHASLLRHTPSAPHPFCAAPLLHRTPSALHPFCAASLLRRFPAAPPRLLAGPGLHPPWVGVREGRGGPSRLPAAAAAAVEEKTSNLISKGKRRIFKSRYWTDILYDIKVFTFNILISRYCNTILYSISNKNFDIVPIKGVQRPWNFDIIPDIEGFSSISKLKPSISKVAKTLELERPQYRIRYRILYRCRYMIGGSYTGPSVPRPPSSNSNEDREMDFEDNRDFMDQDIPAGQFPPADPGPIHQFLSGIPDWLNFNQEDLDQALESLLIPLKGPIPTGISHIIPSRRY
jgi:hypothetical protein